MLIDLNKILVIGDSWSSAMVAGQQGKRKGWPLMLGIPDKMRQGVAGSTAASWAKNKNNMLSKAVKTEADVVIMSLLGNDALVALHDGKIKPKEVIDGLINLHRVIKMVSKSRTIVFLYTDPSFGTNKVFATLMPFVNSAIRSSCPEGVEIFDSQEFLRKEHFLPLGIDIHPNKEGHQAIANALSGILKNE